MLVLIGLSFAQSQEITLTKGEIVTERFCLDEELRVDFIPQAENNSFVTVSKTDLFINNINQNRTASLNSKRDGYFFVMDNVTKGENIVKVRVHQGNKYVILEKNLTAKVCSPIRNLADISANKIEKFFNEGEGAITGFFILLAVLIIISYIMMRK